MTTCMPLLFNMISKASKSRCFFRVLWLLLLHDFEGFEILLVCNSVTISRDLIESDAFEGFDIMSFFYIL